MSDASRVCPACGADNPPERELCGGCGVDLATGAELPHPAVREAPDPPPPRERDREHHRWVIPLVAVLAAAALLVGGLTWAGYGPLAAPPDVPDAAFDDDRYRAEPRPLELAGVAASSAVDDQVSSRLADGQPTTAWRGTGRGTPGDDDVLDVVVLTLASPGWLDRLVLRNGDHADPDAYEDGGRLARVRLVTDAGELVLVDLLDLGLEEQELAFPDPLLVTELRLEILEVFPGGSGAEPTLSELTLVGWDADAQDAELAAERAARGRLEAPLGSVVRR